MSGGSQQLRIFRRTYRDTGDIHAACDAAGQVRLDDGREVNIISLTEAKLTLERDAKNPPPPEAYEPIPVPKEAAMARPKKTQENVEVIKQMDFDRAVKLYRGDIKPALSEAASQNQSIGEAYKAIKKECHIQPQSAKAAIKASEMEEARRDDHLRGFCGMLNALVGFDLVTFNGGDLVDQAEGRDAGPRMKLVTTGDAEPPLQMGVPSDGTETDLAEAGEADDDFTEATEEELARQEGRGGSNDDAEEEHAEAAE